MPEDSRRYISRVGVTEGPFTIDELYDMAMKRQINFQTVFWSERKQDWRPLPGLMLDLDPDKIEEFIKQGIKRVRVNGSHKEEDCRTCWDLVDKTFPVDAPPVLPPKSCRCVPWCRLVLAPVQEA